MDFQSLFLVVGLVIGSVEFVKRAFDKDYRVATIIAVSAIVGALCGAFHVQGVDVATGIVVGLAGSGYVTLAAKVNSQK